MNEINVDRITGSVKNLCIEANKILPPDVEQRICDCRKCERNSLAKEILVDLQRNAATARQLDIPICQDTGMAVVFLDVGQDVHIFGGSLENAVNKGVLLGYSEGLLRKSVVSDPLNRVNTNDNTPAVIHTRIVEGDEIKITVAPKGFGSENMSGMRMLIPSMGRDGVIKAVLDIVKNAASNPCPPMVIGVGIGGDFEQCAMLAKRALCRNLDKPNENKFYSDLEKELLHLVNKLNIGPQGFGGDTTALGLNIEYAPTHIAGLPVAVNIGCHVTRHKSEILR
ncbi:MAG: fumarate hydratase [Oscillospiraceae bacterium]|nr:fumarate hydratase [Oscillospiraceae bacterium]